MFPDAAVLGPWLPHDSFDWMNEEFSFSLDGKVVQRGRVSEQMMAPEPALAYIRSMFPVLADDVIMTGELGPHAPCWQVLLAVSLFHLLRAVQGPPKELGLSCLASRGLWHGAAT